MSSSAILKLVTLACFISLVTIFILYRTGKFEVLFSIQSNLAQNDTIPRKIDSGHTMKASSSKSSILTDDYKNKTFLEIERKIDSIEAQQKKAILFSSSKSGPLFTPNKPKAKIDISKLKNREDTTRFDEVVVIGYSTKSARVFSPKDLEGIRDSSAIKRRNDSIRARYKYLLDSLEKTKAE